jgi:apolipoprotein N-acyltransferase
VATPTVDTGSTGPQPADAATVRAVRAELRRRGEPGRRRTKWRQRRAALRGTGGLRILTAAVGGLALNFSFAPSTQWELAIVGMALFGLAVHGRRLWPAVGLGAVFSLALYLPLLWWTTVYVGGIALALSGILTVLTAPVGALIASAGRRLPGWPFWAAAVWIAGEAQRARWPFGGFPWAGIAFTQADGPLLPVASLIGAPGLGFLTALAGFGLAALVRFVWQRRGEMRTLLRPAALVPVIALLLPFGLGLAGRATELSGDGAPHENIAVIQGNVPEPGLEFNERRRAVLDMHAAETHRLAAAVRAGTEPKPDLVIWPENSSDIDPYANADAAAVITSAAQDIGVPILVGAVVNGPVGSKGTYNMGIVWDPVTGPGATYTKRHPVPFAEYMPYRSFFRIFSHWVDSAGYFIPGTTVGNLDVAGVNVGDVICFEVVYDDLVRDVVNGGAQVLVVQTNNATFGYTNETYQQQAMSRIRAVEHGREVLISATSGVSAVIRPDGAVEGRIGLFTAGTLVPSVPLIDGTTPGTVLGAPVEWTLTIGALVVLGAVTAVGVIRRRRPGTAAAGGVPVPTAVGGAAGTNGADEARGEEPNR